MAHVTLVNQPGDYPGTPDSEMQADLAAQFAKLFPGNPDGQFDENHAGMAIAAHSPNLAMQLGATSGLIGGQLGWSQRKLLRELAIHAVNLHFGSDYSVRSRAHTAEACGVSAGQLAAIPEWQTSPLFDAEQRLTIEYAFAVAASSVSAELFARVKAQWGEREAVECTALIGFWAFWALFLNATGV